MIIHTIKSFLLWLHDADHVSKFQWEFGILPRDCVTKNVESTLVNQNRNRKKLHQTNCHIEREETNNNHEAQESQQEQRKITYNRNVIDECVEEIQRQKQSNSTASTTNIELDEQHDMLDYKIENWYWYYFFQLGSALALPRPRTPPVLQLEKRYLEEYGFPSTHAMFAAGVPVSFVLLSLQRYDFNIWIGIICAAIICDVIAGVIYALFLSYLMFPYVDAIDNFQINFSMAPLFNFIIGYLLIRFYPSRKQWSGARNDTTVILGSVSGFYSATSIMNTMGLLLKPILSPKYAPIYPNYLRCLLRPTFGAILILLTRQIAKTIVLRLTCLFYGVDYRKPECKRLAKIEIPYYYLTYFATGFNMAFTCPVAFHAMGIGND
ncbi:unnamed protein product [Didymodactylos carnosus]|uniref:Uncharacterized protein n=1 Tax=Didymodactylos carnosus TaxID=1234261 RepID=A0A814CEH4_9BILA|nr:unnamed protein product [Didymodactylos carnosus]CAF3715818.1 unnamed protein product [Didymodactylos carnosus]